MSQLMSGIYNTNAATINNSIAKFNAGTPQVAKKRKTTGSAHSGKLEFPESSTVDTPTAAAAPVAPTAPAKPAGVPTPSAQFTGQAPGTLTPTYKPAPTPYAATIPGAAPQQPGGTFTPQQATVRPTYNSGGPTVEQAAAALQQQQDAANAANEQRYQQGLDLNATTQQKMLADISSGYGNILGLVGNTDVANAQEAKLRQQQLGATQQNLVGRGLSNTTIADSLNRGVVNDSALRSQQIQNSANQQKAQVLGAQLNDNLSTQQNLESQRLNFIENRTDEGPNMGMYATLMSTPQGANQLAAPNLPQTYQPQLGYQTGGAYAPSGSYQQADQYQPADIPAPRQYAGTPMLSPTPYQPQTISAPNNQYQPQGYAPYSNGGASGAPTSNLQRSVAALTNPNAGFDMANYQQSILAAYGMGGLTGAPSTGLPGPINTQVGWNPNAGTPPKPATAATAPAQTVSNAANPALAPPAYRNPAPGGYGSFDPYYTSGPPQPAQLPSALQQALAFYGLNY